MREVTQVIGDVFLVTAGVMVLLGLLGLYRFPAFRLRLLAASKIDTVAFILIIFGLCLHSGFTWFTAKALLILIVVLIASPIVTSAIATGYIKSHGLEGSAELPGGEGEVPDGP